MFWSCIWAPLKIARLPCLCGEAGFGGFEVLLKEGVCAGGLIFARFEVCLNEEGRQLAGHFLGENRLFRREGDFEGVDVFVAGRRVNRQDLDVFPHQGDDFFRREALPLFGVETELIDQFEQPGAGEDVLGHRLHGVDDVGLGGGGDVAGRDLLRDYEQGRL
jgi:hypothetical protein